MKKSSTSTILPHNSLMISLPEDIEEENSDADESSYPQNIPIPTQSTQQPFVSSIKRLKGNEHVKQSTGKESPPSNDGLLTVPHRNTPIGKSMEELSMTEEDSLFKPARQASGEFNHSRTKRGQSLSQSFSLRETKTSLTLKKSDKMRCAKDLVDDSIKHNKIFTIIGPYHKVREALRNRGWVEKFYKLQGGVQPESSRTSTTKDSSGNVDSDDADRNDDDGDTDVDDDDADDCGNGSGKLKPWEEDGGVYGVMSRMVRNYTPTFIWSLRKSQVDFRFLRKDQIVNHHAKAGSFTTKVGLTKIMRQMHWVADDYSDNCMPRCYILSVEDDKQQFIEDFRLTACMSIVKIVAQLHNDVPTSDEYRGNDDSNVTDASGDVPLTGAKDSSFDNNAATGGGKKSSRRVLPKIRYEPKIRSQLQVPHDVVLTAIRQCENFLQCKNHEDIDVMQDLYALTDGAWEQFLTNYYKVVHLGAVIQNASSKQERCRELVDQLRVAHPQFHLDGVKNIWIVKPGAKSRGRGITCYNNLETILKLVNTCVPKQETKYVVQKYIERPYLVYNTKYDIRQWFLVTDWNPLTIWWYKDCYLRFCSQQFTLEDFDESVHLSNNSIQYKYENGPRSQNLPNENMWDSDQFVSYLRRRGESESWDSTVQPGMRNGVVAAMLCAQDHIDIRKNCFELYGADFMMTDDMRPWLIEINASPCMAASTSVTARLTTNVLEDTIKVVIDRRKDRHCDVGRFDVIYKQPLVTVPSYVGIDLTLVGKPCRTRWWNPNTTIERPNEVPKHALLLTSSDKKSNTYGSTSTLTSIPPQKILQRAASQQNLTSNIYSSSTNKSKRVPVIPSVVSFKKCNVTSPIRKSDITDSSKDHSITKSTELLSGRSSSAMEQESINAEIVTAPTESCGEGLPLNRPKLSPTLSSVNPSSTSTEITIVLSRKSDEVVETVRSQAIKVSPIVCKGITRVEVVDLSLVEHSEIPRNSKFSVTNSTNNMSLKLHKSFSGSKPTSLTSKSKSWPSSSQPQSKLRSYTRISYPDVRVSHPFRSKSISEEPSSTSFDNGTYMRLGDVPSKELTLLERDEGDCEMIDGNVFVSNSFVRLNKVMKKKKAMKLYEKDKRKWESGEERFQESIWSRAKANVRIPSAKKLHALQGRSLENPVNEFYLREENHVLASIPSNNDPSMWRVRNSKSNKPLSFNALSARLVFLKENSYSVRTHQPTTSELLCIPSKV